LFLAVSAHAGDWLVDPTPYRAAVRTNASEIVLENGLVRRIIRLAPNAATIRYDNLMTGNNVVRAVRPEARIELDGASYNIGGLDGQPVGNYLDPRWLDKMTAITGAYQFQSCRVGRTVERFPWKKRLEWMPQDMPWPPPGQSVTLRFVPPAGAPAALTAPVIREEDFSNQTSLKPGWKVLKAGGYDRASFVNEGKAGEIMAYSAMAVCAEHAWPAGAQSVEVELDAGTDRSAAWGPGLALVTGGNVLRFNTRPGEGKYEAAGKISGKFDAAKPCRLRVRLDKGNAIFEAAQQGNEYAVIGSAPCPQPPTALRVGKVGLNGTGTDAGADKTDVRLRIIKVAWRGAEQAAPVVPRADLPVVDVHYEIYDGIPLISKWVSVTNPGQKTVRLNTVVTEILAAVEPESYVGGRPGNWINPRPDIYVESDYAMAGDGNPRTANRVVHWKPDPLYKTQVQYDRSMPCLLECHPERGPDQEIAPGGRFESFRVFELLFDGGDRERNSLAQRKMYRTIAPWVTQNPILMHVRSAKPEAVKLAIDQCANVGFEMVIMTFGSGFNFESRDPKYQAQIKELADYARSKGIALGAYSLLASRGAGTPADNTQGAPTAFGLMPCLGAKWGIEYLEQLKNFMAYAGLELLEHDGSYPGDACAATTHPGHRGLDDSQWVMWRAITDLYKWCCANGVYLNIPDWYILNGAPKTYMGYRETNWSLPREYQEIIERQNIFDGTWFKTPSMGWMFVPLTEYHGGGAAATIEPLKEHLPHYEQRLANLFGAGVQACYRGPRLYDAPETEALVKKWVAFYKKHRQVLDADILHLRRADGQDIDYILHVNPAGKEKGLLMVYNPLEQPVSKTLTVPLYYTGLTKTAKVCERDGAAEKYELDREYKIQLPVTVPARGVTWFVFE
jgi:hypothetical protein